MESSGKPRKPKLFAIRRVVGDSMLPALKPGALVVAFNLPPRVGNVVIAWQAEREVIKRVTDSSSDGIFLQGDNLSHSSDSRTYGRVARSQVYGRVVWPRV